MTDLSSTTGPKREGDPFAALHDPAIFAQAQSDDWGDGLSWPVGLDLGADQLYNLSASRRACPRAIQRGMGGHAAEAVVQVDFLALRKHVYFAIKN
ncbi:hypothetical protein [Acidithiobacillus sp.]|uniref:hypothetical protein n=1 Tax=Acidithiobacillus sp. TaxID=1872118 RepID=UPI003CFFB08F